jgi:N-dimethylarginine dimethylaminohydrolase|tara:strand:- start:301 stop:471 length:171 start_codon:yes stop_codon:yes gene_type:complete
MLTDRDHLNQWEESLELLEQEETKVRRWRVFEKFTIVVFTFSTGYFLYHTIRFFNQ